MKKLQLRFVTNKVTARWLLILNILERERNCSSQELSQKTQLSSRTIIKEIKDIRDYFGNTIELSTNNTGYLFHERQYDLYQNLKRALITEDPLFVIVQGILTGDLRSAEEWAFHFHLSESTMKRYLLSIIPILEKYCLQLSLSPVDFIGDEGNIRKFFKDFYYEVDIIPHTVIPLQSLKEMMPETEVSGRLSGFLNTSPSDFRYFIYIMIQRCKNKNMMKILNVKITYTATEWDFLTTLKDNIKTKFHYELSDNELLVTYIYAKSQRKLVNLEEEKEYCSRFSEGFKEKEWGRLFLSGYDKKFHQAQPDISYFVEAFFISVRWLDYIGSTLNSNVYGVLDFAKKLYPKDYEWVLSFLRKEQSSFSFSLLFLEDIAASLVLTVEAVRDIYQRNPKNIAFLLEGSHFITQSVHAKAYRYLRGYHRLFFLTIEDLNQSYLKEHAIDLLVTNQEEYLSEFLEDIDFVLFKAIPDQSDWNLLLKKINPQIARDFSLAKTALNE